MNRPLARTVLLRLCLLAAGLAHFSTSAFSQATGGTIEGRVFNTRNGEYLEKARVTIEGSQLETFTDSTGQYRFVNVPTGTARVRAFYTGLVAQSVAVSVGAGQIAQRDFNLADADARPGTGDTTVKLDQFIVSTSKEMDGAAIAINEQRFAANVMNVVAADEFGAVAEGNVGEFLKFLPGITIDYVGGDARTISMNGVPPDNVPVTVGGFNLASAQSSGTARTVELEQVSINNVARIEVSYTPTPETTGSALAGAVNMVPRGAFERSRPQFNGSVYVMMRDAERSLRKTPGPIRDETYKIHPGFDFSYVAPVNRTFGFTLSGGHSTQYTMQDFTQSTWRGVSAATSAPTAANPFGNLPDTTPDKPYLSDYTVRDGTKVTQRSSAGATIDYKLSRNHRVSFAFQYALFDAEFNNRSLLFLVNRVNPGDYDTFNTNGYAGAGEIRVSTGSRDKRGTTYMPTLRYYYDGPVWKGEAGAGLSHATNHYTDIARGYFNATQVRRTNVTVAFRDIFFLRPRIITVHDGVTGAPVNPYALSSYNLNTANSDARETADMQRSAFANLRRDFMLGRIPFSIKTGVDIRHSMRDIRGENPTYTHVGSDGVNTANPNVANGANDNAGSAGILDEIFSQRQGVYGFPPIQYPSNFKLWEYATRNPNYWTINRDTEYARRVELSKHAEEVISSAYVRGDMQLFERRLKLVGGVRVEQTNVSGEGRLIDPTRNFQQRPDGSYILGANGRPLTIAPAGVQTTMLTNVDRGLRAEKEYFRWFPSLNASFNLRENLIARAGYYHSVGRPNFSQYAGSLTLPDTELPASTSNRITVNNAGIKAWEARTYKVTLEYYFERVGLFSVGAFRRDFTNMFATTVFNASPEFLSLYSLDPDDYDRFDVSTQYNLQNQVRMTGIDFNYKQALTFLPPWARGLQIFANGSAQRAIGDETNAMANYIPRSGSWGISLSRPAYNLRVNWNYRGKHRRGLVAAGRSIEPNTYNWGTKRLYLDVLGEYYFYKRFAVFANLRNIGDATEDFEIHNPRTPEHAQFRQREDFGSLWTFGLKGTF